MSMELSPSRPMSCRGRAAGLRLAKHLSAQLDGDIAEAMGEAVVDMEGFKWPEVVLFQAKGNAKAMASILQKKKKRSNFCSNTSMCNSSHYYVHESQTEILSCSTTTWWKTTHQMLCSGLRKAHLLLSTGSVSSSAIHWESHSSTLTCSNLNWLFEHCKLMLQAQ